MWKHTELVTKNLSLRISLLAVLAMAVLLFAALLVMFSYSRQTMKEDALSRASQTLDGASGKIDNILLSVEETTGNVYYMMLPYLNNPDSVDAYSRRIVDTNPYITGCAIAMRPGFYPDREEFMAYYRREEKEGQSHIVRLDSFGHNSYTEQMWYTKPMRSFTPMWLNPLVDVDTDIEPITSFCLPIADYEGKPQGVMCVDVSLSLLSGIIAAAKPSPNSYCVMLDRDGSFIVHPLGEQLMNITAFDVGGESVREAAQAMTSGESGYRPMTIDDEEFYIFYKPFERAFVPNRAMGNMGWSVGVVISKDDIFGDFNHLFYYVLIIAVEGLLLMFIFSWLVVYVGLKPLKMLADKVFRISQGHYFEPIPDTKKKDEIGILQRNFQRMQLSLAVNVKELQQLTNTIKQHSNDLREAYKEAKKADKMRTVFLHNMTNQMVEPAEAIDKDVALLSRVGEDVDRGTVVKLSKSIQKRGEAIAQLLNHLFHQTEEEMRKEVEHV